MKPGASNRSLREDNCKGRPSMFRHAAKPVQGPIRFSERDSVWRGSDHETGCFMTGDGRES